MNTAVIGASGNPDKYSYMALKLLEEKGHRVFPVHPSMKDIEGRKVYASITDISEPIDTVTLYVSHEVSTRLADAIFQKAPRRIIFNPGAENPELEKNAKTKGIGALEACTLVLLKTGQF